VCLGQLIVSLFPWSTARRGPLDTWQHQSSPLKKTESEAVRHVIAPELTSSRRQGPEPRDTWQHRSSPQQRGEVQGRGTRGGTEAHLCSESRYRAAGHMMALDPNSVEMCDLKLQLMWQRVDTHPTPYLNLELVCEVHGLQDTDNFHQWFWLQNHLYITRHRKTLTYP
jgi:hypothetical protein